MFTPVALAALFVVFIAFTWVLALADSALTYISRREAEEVLREHPRSRILEVTAERDAHLGALRVWRFITEALGAVCLTAAAVWVLEGVWAAVGVAALVLVATAALLGVWSPRPIGSRNETAVARRTAGLVWGLRRALGPIGTRLGQDRRRGDDEVNEEDDYEERHLREVVARAHDADVLADSEAELIQSVFSMNDTIVRSVMVPRTDVVTIDDDHTLAQSMDLFLRSGCSRVPVIGEDADDVRGMLYLKDVTRALHHEGAASGDPVTGWMRDVRFVPDSKSVAGLLQELQRESTHVAIVVDEYGGTAGVVTLEDVVEEIVGEVADEHDRITPGVLQTASGRWYFPADLRPDEAQAQITALSVPEDGAYETIGGFVMARLGRIARVGDVVAVDGGSLAVERMDGRRVERVRFDPVPADRTEARA